MRTDAGVKVTVTGNAASGPLDDEDMIMNRKQRATMAILIAIAVAVFVAITN
ncbi:hypothetical protein [Bauldia sp.]|uniref:hypothetical protein n=1 Tax=Bauldia sp. TaxID=2575872 RepID=UPI003BABB1FF